MDSKQTQANRRHWLFRVGMGLGGVAALELASQESMTQASVLSAGQPTNGVLPRKHHAPKAKRVI